jgi:CO dehydrogenase maturation factor
VEHKDSIYPTSKWRIAVTGKGGVGKTIVSALMSRFFISSGRKVLLVDADPSIGLAYLLGVETDRSVGDYRDRMIREPKLRKELETLRIKDTLFREAMVKLPGFNLLIMGRDESAGCYCQVNRLLKYGIGSIAKDYEVMLIDCEAGLEQINRRVIDSIDTLLIVTDTSARGVNTAIKIRNLVEKNKAIKNCGRLGLIINRVKGRDNIIREIAEETRLEILGSIPEDENIRRLDLEGEPISELSNTSASVVAVRKIFEALNSGGK